MFIKLADVYAFPQTVVTNPFEFSLNENVMPDLADVFNRYPVMQSVIETLIPEGRFVQKLVAEESRDNGRWWADLKTFWFDGTPFAIVLAEGKGGSGDISARYITNYPVYLAAIRHVLELAHETCRMDDDDVVSSLMQVPVETLFAALPAKCKALGLRIQKRSTDVFGLEGDALRTLPAGHILIGSKKPEVPEVLRNGRMYFERRRILSEEEAAPNEHLLSNFAEMGFPHVFVYAQMEKAPLDVESVISF